MTEVEQKGQKAPLSTDVSSLVRDAIREYMQMEQEKAEPAYKAELLEERKRREHLELRVNELVQENQRTRAQAEEAERSSTIRTELQRLGVTKVDLAYRAIRDDVFRTPDGRLLARSGSGETDLREYLQQFINENPELLPARIAGGSGVKGGGPVGASGSIDIDRIKPGMSAEELEKVRQEVWRVAAQAGLNK